MHERKAVKQFKKLSRIKPDQEWAEAVKEEILEQGLHHQAGFSIWQQLYQVLAAPLQRPVLAVAPLVLVVAVLAGLVVYFNMPRLSDIPAITTIISRPKISNQTLASLNELEISLIEVSQKLDGLRQAGNTGRVLSTTQAVEASAQKGRELVARVAEADDKTTEQVLASLSGLFDEVEEKAGSIQKEKAAQMLQQIKARDLDDSQQVIFGMAEEYYEAGKYIDALLLLQRISL